MTTGKQHVERIIGGSYGKDELQDHIMRFAAILLEALEMYNDTFSREAFGRDRELELFRVNDSAGNKIEVKGLLAAVHTFNRRVSVTYYRHQTNNSIILSEPTFIGKGRMAREDVVALYLMLPLL